jgi:regulator of protease activity HflC (stomatin/prohibitin superfamily)
MSANLAGFAASAFMHFVIAAVVTFVAVAILVPVGLALCRAFGAYTIVNEGHCKVYMLFGKVVAVINEPGLHFLLATIGPKALIVNWLGQCHELDLRLDQDYLRSQPVNSEEGAPMGIGIWYERFISDPISYLFKNTDPRGSLSANVSNSTVRCLSNLPLDKMLEDRHSMSQVVRDEVSPKSNEWGYQLGSVYIRKVHFRDTGMISQIEAKVVNRLRQVTSAIKQAGANQVSIITSTAERQAAIEFARAAAMRPHIVGEALKEISQDARVTQALFDVLEVQNIISGQARITLIPPNREILSGLLAGESGTGGEGKVNKAG